MRLLVVDDESTICWGLARLGEELGHEVVTASSAETGLEAASRQPPDLLILDVRLPGMDGFTAIEHFRRHIGTAPIVVITAYGDLATAVESVRRGAFEYLVKPFDLALAQHVIERALRWRVEASNPGQASDADAAGPHPAGLVGRSAPMQDVFKRIALVADSDACVHLSGESGTGKELIARAVHQFSRRHEGPFVAVNVAALNPSLVESELFGHVRGAFTGAEQPHRGLLEQSHGGTIFLDEVAEIPSALQVKLLRTVEHGEVLPVGAGRPIQIDLRVISATHRNLQDRVADGSFRHDLYFRLSTFQIDVPPLRSRRDDIRPLAEYFLATFAEKSGAPSARLSAEALAELERRPWYGNVRELRNAIEHALVLTRAGTIGSENLAPPAAAPPDSNAAGGNPSDEQKIAALVRRWAESQLKKENGQNGSETEGLYEQLLDLVEPPLLEAVLAQHHGQRAAAARTLGLHRMTLRKKLTQFGMEET
jgi:two-component system nitrogen regulation response regulator GlnG